MSTNHTHRRQLVLRRLELASTERGQTTWRRSDRVGVLQDEIREAGRQLGHYEALGAIDKLRHIKEIKRLRANVAALEGNLQRELGDTVLGHRRSDLADQVLARRTIKRVEVRPPSMWALSPVGLAMVSIMAAMFSLEIGALVLVFFGLVGAALHARSRVRRRPVSHQTTTEILEVSEEVKAYASETYKQLAAAEALGAEVSELLGVPVEPMLDRLDELVDAQASAQKAGLDTAALIGALKELYADAVKLVEAATEIKEQGERNRQQMGQQALTTLAEARGYRQVLEPMLMVADSHAQLLGDKD